jgi:DNA-binding ferritin-like protein (Dps family)
MKNIIEAIIGDLNEKKRYRDAERRALALPREYSQAYKDIKTYLWSVSGIMSIEPLVSLADLLEEAAANGRRVIDITGPDVAAFADELAKGETSWKDQQREKLNKKFIDKSIN